MLLIGPPGSGKTHRVLEQLEAAVRQGRGEQVRLVVPTASMAQHLLHQMARRGLAVPGDCILPLAAFVESFTPGCREVSTAIETFLLEKALERALADEFAAVAAYPGFHAKLLATMEEFWSAGAEAGTLEPLLEGPLARAFAHVMAEYEKLLAEAGAIHRAQRLRLAAREVSKQELKAVLFDGFFNFTPVELELLRAVVKAAQKCVVTLPESGADEARGALVAMGMKETRLEQIYRPRLKPFVVQASSPEREIEDIAGRILSDREKTGRPFQEYGLILRHPEIYGPLVGVVFERFGIPFRSRRPEALEAHSSIRFLAGLLKLIVHGFNGGETLEVMKLAGSGVGLSGEMDKYEFSVRDAATDPDLEFLRKHAKNFPGIRKKLAQFEELSAWGLERLAPRAWAQRCERLAQAFFHFPAIGDEVAHEVVLEWKSLAGALEAWGGAAGEAAEALQYRGPEKVELAEYLETLEAVLRLTLLRAPDQRRNVVQVLSVYEARQWELPVVFVCGLLEKQFPRYHSQNLFFPDARRRQLCARGLRLRTSEDLDREERFLFDLAMTRATEQVYLTYPAQDEDGGETLRSFFLGEWEPETVAGRRVRVRERAPEWQPPPAFLEDPVLQEAVAEQHERFSPSSLEEYLQCPFQFFARRTLRLEEWPLDPEERINEPVKGTIIHRAIARWAANQAAAIGPVFEEVFAEVCAEEGIRLNLRAEAMKIQLRADLERFAGYERERGRAPGFQAAKPESEFEYIVEEGVERPFRVTGRIDRYEVSEGGAAVVVDYKYSTGNRIRRLLQEHEEGQRLQLPLYLLGLEKQMGLKPGGMLFYGLRKEPSRGGWFDSGLVPADSELESKSPAEFRAMLEAAADRTLRIVQEIRHGRVEVAPRDRQICREFCPYLDVCRVNL